MSTGDPRRPVVIVGAGLIGAKRAAALDDRQFLHSIVDVDLGRAEQLARQYSVPAHQSFERALEQLTVGGLVIIATTHVTLAQLAGQAIEAGHHVLIEKPGARNAAELAPIIARAADLGLTVRVGFNHRFHPGISRLIEQVRGGEYGPVRVIRARYGHGGRPGYEKEWRAQRELSGGGELLDQGSHLIDLTRAIADDLTEVTGFAETLHWPMEVEDNAFVSGRLPGGGRAWLHASWTEWKNLFSLEVFCTTAKFEVEGLGGSYGPEVFRRSFMTEGFGPPEVTSVQFPPGDESWRLEMTDVENAIVGTGASGASGDDALATLEVVGMIYEQALQGASG